MISPPRWRRRWPLTAPRSTRSPREPQRADFANTIEALEAAGHLLDQVLGVFFTVAGADSKPAREALQRDFSPKLSAHFSEISANKALFARVDAVWAGAR